MIVTFQIFPWIVLSFNVSHKHKKINLNTCLSEKLKLFFIEFMVR